MQIYGSVGPLECKFMALFKIAHFWSNLLAGGTRTIFSTLHGSLWLGKDKGSIMESAESCGTIYNKHYYGNKLFE